VVTLLEDLERQINVLGRPVSSCACCDWIPESFVERHWLHFEE
jgi:hypothetical protein